MSRKIIVTGGCGFIGSNFISTIVDMDGIEIINIDKLTEVSNKNIAIGAENYTLIEDDVCNIDKYVEQLKGSFCCVHFAAESHVDRSIENVDPFLKSNITGSYKVAEFCAKQKIKMIHISTDEVYGHIKAGSEHKFDTYEDLIPRNPYSASKAAAEVMVKSVGEMYPDFHYSIVRPSNNYGPGQDGTKFIPKVIKSIVDGTPFPMYGDGCFYREWTHVFDTCHAIYRLMNTTMDGEIYNISSEHTLSNIEMFTFITHVFRVGRPNEFNKSLVEFIECPRGNAHDIKYAIKDSKLIEQFREIETTMGGVVDWYLDEQK